MELELEGKVALVSGASQGLGRAICATLAEAGMKVLATARNPAALDDLAASGPTGAIAAFPADLKTREAAGACVDAALARFGGLHLVVNSAGDTKRGSFLELTDDDWHDGYELKLHGTVRLCRAAWPHLVRTGGSVVNIAGIGSRTPSADFTIGGSVNSALLNFGKALADLGRPLGVRVNTINPGHIDTDRLSRRIESLLADGKTREQAAGELLVKYGIARFGRAEEIADLVAFLASSRGDYFTGSTLDLDGGATRGL